MDWKINFDKEDTKAMEEFILKRFKHLLWKDELGDTFLLLKYAEVYKYSEDVLRMVIFLRQKAFQLKKLIPILREDSTDDGLYIFDVNIQYLDRIIQLGAFKRRPPIHGRWILDKERRLAHKIIPYNPKIKD